MSTAWLAEHLDDPGVVPVDCRWYLAPFDQRVGTEEYARGHIPGAVHLQWDTDLADPDRPGLGMLAPPDRFAAVMGAAGVGDDTLVVAYDDRQVTVAARLWWALRVNGHDRVAVLDGGMQAWRAEGRPETTALPVRAPAVFTPGWRPELYVTKAELQGTLGDPDLTLVDGRMGPARSVDGGQIPGSHHLPGIEFSEPGGHWLASEEAAAAIRGSGVDPATPGRIVAYCRGGVGATGTALGFALAGRDDVAVYDGSWGEWSLDPDTPKAPL